MRRTVQLAAVLFCAAVPVAVAAVQDRPPAVPPPYLNIQVLAGVSAEELGNIMDAVSRSLGVGCDYCHVPGNWDRDDRRPKRTAREMMRMTAAASETHFAVLETPSCWTCHRGAAVPALPPPLPEAAPVPSGAFSDENRPAGEVYRNVVTFRDLPASRLGAVMTEFSRSLGVDCAYCHVAGDWSSDARLTKELARVMAVMEQALETEFFGGRNLLSCWTCHRGSRTPETNLP